MQMQDDDEDDEQVEGMSSNDEDEDIMAGVKDKDNCDLISSLDMTGLSEKEKRSKLKMVMVNKRLDELITVLDTCSADL